MKKISQWIFKIIGWETIVGVEEPVKSVICVAPHTSNWDFFIGKFTYWALGRKSYFLMKKSWFFFPLGILLRSMGGVPIDRSKRTSVTEQMVEEFNKHETFHLAITPEGTRSKVHKWKMGFYHIAFAAGVPIQLAYIDYKKKEMGITELLIPTGDEKADMKKIKAFYRNVTARHPRKFHL
ncbi:MAG: lysophospholipid acyltransferase family protein [Paludibacter sp.]|nr:lysophospholipid acyltransferase family protein [Paludibacter sp.]